jgi:uncharacterized protein YihD (DUF1040 family)
MINKIIKRVITSTLKNRKKYNEKILTILQREVEENPELRFIQILHKVGIIDGTDKFYEEPKLTYEKIKKEINEEKRNKR